MPRPRKCCCVERLPEVAYFCPGGASRKVEEVCLSLEEVEAIRLKDVERLEQSEGAERMRISRPTFQRILESARRKVAEALLEGKAIRMGGGNFEMAVRQFRCHGGHEWEIHFDDLVAGFSDVCPRCGSANILPIQPGCHQRGWRHGCGRGRRPCPREGGVNLKSVCPKEISGGDTG